MQSICVYCGSSNGNSTLYTAVAKQLGAALVRHNLRLVYGGASIGIMGVVADAVLAAGGEVIGVIPQVLVDKEVAHHGLTALHCVSSMHERKALMADLSDGFIALPGGLGTLEELFEMLTWGQLGLHRKPCALLNVNNYYSALITFLDTACEQGFISRKHRDLLLVDTCPEALIDTLKQYQAPDTAHWIEQKNS